MSRPITQEQFAEFQKWMQERHNEDRDRARTDKEEIMARFDKLPCQAHDKRIGELEKSRALIAGYAAAIAASVTMAVEVFFGMPHKPH